MLEQADATGIVDVALGLVRALAAEEGVQLRASIAGELLPVLADRQRLVQVLQNLVANAVQHAARGTTVEVAVGTTPRGDGRAVEFLVLDRGPGFREGDEARIFEPFFSRRPGGTGMGLAIAHRLVNDHGGEITAANREGGGACLRVVLPSA